VIVSIRPIRRKPVLTHASIVFGGMLASVNSMNSVNSAEKPKTKCFELLNSANAL